MSRTFPAVPATVPEARELLAATAAQAGASPDRLDAIRLAVSEALTNAIIHAYPDGPGEIDVTCAVLPGELSVLIGDHGTGLRRGTPSPGLGLGLALMTELSDSLTIAARSTGGTEIRMTFTISTAEDRPDQPPRGSSRSATRPASPRFSTTA